MVAPTMRGYASQLYALAGWSSLLWLHRLRQPTLVMAGADDPLVPLPNAWILARRIPDARLEVFDCGHLFLLTTAAPEDPATDTLLRDVTTSKLASSKGSRSTRPEIPGPSWRARARALRLL
jgi:pimeloyl-ACP methyl ester carboxylesterase